MLKKTKREICYPIFLEVASLATDPFWKMLYQDFAYNTYPIGIQIDEQVVLSTFKGQQFHYDFSAKTADEICHELTDLLRTKRKIYSKKDTLSQRDYLSHIFQEHKREWRAIKKKNIKDILIENFIITFRQKYNLTLKQSQLFHRFINIQFYFKRIVNENVHYGPDSCTIEQIDNIHVKYIQKNKLKIWISLDSNPERGISLDDIKLPPNVTTIASTLK
jgi:hypothetical protein